nr:hypothetical protein [Angustibacter aerolatus]
MRVLSPRTAPRAVVADDPTGRRPGLVTLVPAGAYARTVAWSDRRDWLAGVRLAVQARPELLRLGDTSKDVVSIDTFMRVLEAMAAAADHDTGRDIRARKREIAAAAHCSADTVQRCRRIATRVVGCLRLVVRGRPLTMPERTTVRHRRDRTAPKGADGRRPGLTQRGVPPVYAAHTPAGCTPTCAWPPAAPCTCPPAPPAVRSVLPAAGPGGWAALWTARWTTSSPLTCTLWVPHPTPGGASRVHQPTYRTPTLTTKTSSRSARPSGRAPPDAPTKA